ncbi:T9SS type A sorting domain-containing protein [Pontibacter qinzhouensis]|uniref:T9SS type A sorting domain-containing protein n=1 Tax=Pontibacter qinzhouensis TaxID=2603253 RepID=A0A5C8K6T0_9BACT|nr:alpha-amylase family glycosyl hydrolase [Pontibacter qinzhouensis]TXK46101.1 T9SS type A sorting domain-containing protein [Pontibacter qinzhouensis]
MKNIYIQLLKNKHLFSLVLLLLAGYHQLLAQAVTTVPAFPTADQEVTIIVDLKQATDTRAAGLLGKTSDVYLWAGAGTTAEGGAFEFTPAGQTTWTVPFEPGRMTSLGNDRWEIKLVPRTYFGVPADKPIVKLGLLLKNGNGSAQTEDFIIPIYTNALQVVFENPTQASFFTEANTTIPIKATASAPADMTLRVDNVVVKTEQQKTVLEYNLNAGTQSGVRRRVDIEAKAGTETATQTFYFTVKPVPAVADLPTGNQDGINYLSSEKVLLSFFAPHKSFVYVIGEFNNWTPTADYLLHRTPDGNRYWIELDNMPPGQEVAYQYLVDGTLAVADPYADKILDPNNDQYIPAATYPGLKAYPAGATGIVSVLQTNQVPYNWRIQNFERPDPTNMVVYELLVRDFVATRNYKTLADTLTYLKRLGVNAIELMPVNEFSGNDSWGYNPIFYFAPDKAYGTKNDLKAFIDKCHEYGMAVILDMVLNQADYEFPYVKLYWDGSRPAANSPYFNQEATHPFNVFFDFNHESEATKRLVQRVNQYWIEEYNIDGYRFDLSKGFTQKNSGGNVSTWSAYDASRVATWKRIYNEIRSYDATAYVMLEHFADNQEEKELADYGMLFWGNHNHDYRNLAKGIQANPNWISYKQRNWNQPHVVGYLESHDEERLLYDVLQAGRSEGGYNTRNLNTALNRSKLATAFFLPVPGPKLIWQFGELGYDVAINFNGRTGEKPIRWEYQQDPERQKLYNVYAALINLKLTEPAFQTSDFTLDFGNVVKRITLRHETMDVHILGNFDTKLQSPNANFPKAGMWYDYFTGEEIFFTNTAERLNLQPGEFRLFTTVKLPAPLPNLLPWQQLVLSAEEATAADKQVLVYPNPARNTALVEVTGAYRGAVEMKLTDNTGRVLRTVRATKHNQTLQQPLSLQNMAGGIYFLQIEKGTERTVLKMVKLED